MEKEYLSSDSLAAVNRDVSQKQTEDVTVLIDDQVETCTTENCEEQKVNCMSLIRQVHGL